MIVTGLYWSNEPIQFTKTQGDEATIRSHYFQEFRKVVIPERVKRPMVFPWEVGEPRKRWAGRRLPIEWGGTDAGALFWVIRGA